MRNAITCYIARDDLLILVPDTDEMASRIQHIVGPVTDGIQWIVLAPGSEVIDLREGASETVTDYTMRRLRGNK